MSGGPKLKLNKNLSVISSSSIKNSLFAPPVKKKPLDSLMVIEDVAESETSPSKLNLVK